jgi:hypothetical protein
MDQGCIIRWTRGHLGCPWYINIGGPGLFERWTRAIYKMDQGCFIRWTRAVYEMDQGCVIRWTRVL